ncbi:MAG: BrnA antitoxin family protein [Burkholderiales bacterium]
MHKSNDTNHQRFADVWDAIEDTPEEAARMRALSKSKMEADALASQSDEDGNPTTEVTLWLDVEVVDKFKAFGDDWQTRINAVLRAHA